MRTVTVDSSFSIPPAKVFSLFFDLDFLGAATGSKARIRPEIGSKYFVGGCAGRVVHIEKNELLVRTMRLASWAAAEGDAVSVFRFQKTDAGTDVSVVVTGVPDAEAEAIKKMVNSSLGAMKDHLTQSPEKQEGPRKLRGRPPKAASGAKKATTGEPKRRGRPPKARPEGKLKGDSAPKRRGRPPKIAAASSVPGSPKRRGRPPKSASAPNSGPNTVPKRRGRPPKTAS